MSKNNLSINFSNCFISSLIKQFNSFCSLSEIVLNSSLFIKSILLLALINLFLITLKLLNFFSKFEICLFITINFL